MGGCGEVGIEEESKSSRIRHVKAEVVRVAGAAEGPVRGNVDERRFKEGTVRREGRDESGGRTEHLAGDSSGFW